MTSETIYQMAGRYLAASRIARETRTLTRETSTVKPADAAAGTSGGTTTESVRETETAGSADTENASVAMLNGVIFELSGLADEYSRQKGNLTGRYIPREIRNMRDPFPLPDRFAPAAAFYFASLLCLPFDREMSELLNSRGDAVREAIRRELTGVITPTANVYPFP